QPAGEQDPESELGEDDDQVPPDEQAQQDAAEGHRPGHEDRDRDPGVRREERPQPGDDRCHRCKGEKGGGAPGPAHELAPVRLRPEVSRPHAWAHVMPLSTTTTVQPAARNTSAVAPAVVPAVAAGVVDCLVVRSTTSANAAPPGERSAATARASSSVHPPTIAPTRPPPPTALAVTRRTPPRSTLGPGVTRASASREVSSWVVSCPWPRSGDAVTRWSA